MKIRAPQAIIFVLYTALLLSMSFNSLEISRKYMIFSYDKVIHYLEFLVFGVLLLNLFRLSDLNRLEITFIASVSILVPLADELIQLYTPSRVSSFYDLGVDYLGVFSGIMLLLYLCRNDKKNKYQ